MHSVYHLYVRFSADLYAGEKLIARSDSVREWEKFRRHPLSDGKIALRAEANGKFVSVNDGGALVANREEARERETFRIAG